MRRSSLLCILFLLFASIADGQGLSSLFSGRAAKSAGVQADCQPLSITTYNWNAGGQNWDESLRLGIAYNDSGWPATEIGESYFQGNYTNSFRNSYSYNNSGLVLEEISEFWTGSAWENDERITFAYDSRDSLTARTFYSWTGGAWDTTAATLFSFTYNGMSQLTQWETQEWNDQSRAFENDSRERYAYNGSGEIDTFYVDIFIAGIWTSPLRYTDILWFDFPNRLLASYILQTGGSAPYSDFLRVYQLFSGPFNDLDGFIESYDMGWDSLRKYKVRYDSEGSLRLDEEYEYDTLQQAFVQSTGRNILSTYDMDGCKLEQIDQLLTVNGYQNSIRRVFSSTGVSAPGPSALQSSLSIFPHPATEHLSFALEMERAGRVHYRLLDIQGGVLLENNFLHPGGEWLEKIALDLPAGAYVLHIEAGGESIARKVLLR